MKKESISFSWDKYITGKYKVETNYGDSVIISGRNPDTSGCDRIVGWYGDTASSWDDDGYFLRDREYNDFNLVLIPVKEELEPVNEKTTDYAELTEELPEGEFYGFTGCDYEEVSTTQLSTAIERGEPGTNIFHKKLVGVIKSKKVLERI